jgi:hypothetical protein
MGKTARLDMLCRSINRNSPYVDIRLVEKFHHHGKRSLNRRRQRRELLDLTILGDARAPGHQAEKFNQGRVRIWCRFFLGSIIATTRVTGANIGMG